MAHLATLSRSELAQRRRQLRHQRRLKRLQAGWHILAVAGLAGSLVWVTTLPIWIIHNPAQVKIEGNQLLSSQAIRSLLPLQYPQSLLRLQPQAIAQTLESQAPIAKVTVTRQLWPPGLTVHVQERHPVAVTQVSSATTNLPGSGTGLLDAHGMWMPLESYQSHLPTAELPQLKVLGLSNLYRSYWPDLYQIIAQSPVKIWMVDCRDPADLVLETELGSVHLGPYSARFSAQMQALDQMRQLPNRINTSRIAYIDLKNPNAPALQIVKTENKMNANLR
ncbi:cell division protein FtsQ [Neosynechococcus sphagnicola sy1]|uniref:Cell division protein FtsQ n=1 Tax=Neosynechococcus sphagnicola sy1 TaxID=1497020 RepID=A0A098TII0_9CYAN|nr:FtsQ-type POTRA domain-containing protein [Neosynechococcus sphagnicola]KGF71919.1 cell division protein FtsQ [Neosynechococcus sphagnicola sy1]